MNSTWRTLTTSLLAGTGLLAASHGYGAWVVDPSARLEVSFDDNVRMEQDDEPGQHEQEGVVATATAQARVRNLTEISELSGVAGFTYLTYQGVDDLDDQPTGFLDLRASRRTERTDYGLRASARSEVILRRVQEILDDFEPGDGDMDLGDDGQAPGDDLPGPGDEPIDGDIDDNVVREQIERTRIILTPYVGYALNERTDARLGYSYFALRYEAQGEDAGLRDSDSHSVYGQLTRDLSPRDRVNLRVQMSRFEPDESIDSDAYEATVGWTRDVSPRITVGVELGARQVDSELSDSYGTVFALQGVFDTERGEFSGFLQRSVLPSAFGDLVEADRLDLSYRRAISERMSFGFSVRGFDTRRDSGDSDRDRSYLSAGPRLNWALSPAWDVGVAYTYRWTQRENESGSAAGNSVSLSLIYRPPSRL